MQFTGGHVIAADMVGGVYSLKVDEDAPAGGGEPPKTTTTTTTAAAPGPTSTPAPAGNAGCTDRDRPATRFTTARLNRKGITLRGRSTDAGCSGVNRVQVAIGRQVARKRCRFVKANGKLTPARSCSRPVYLTAKGTQTWSFSKRVRLARRSHLVFARATDKAGNREKFALRVNGKRVRVR